MSLFRAEMQKVYLCSDTFPIDAMGCVHGMLVETYERRMGAWEAFRSLVAEGTRWWILGLQNET